MVGSSKRSPSPLTSRSIPNLPRSLETHQNQPTRKSFNTFTRPRNLVCGEEKENEKGQFLKAAAKMRSPSNGSKNFMAPTISAASKFTPSPRKKILVERNDPVRTSITLSDGKATFFSSLSTDLTSHFDRKHDGCPEEKVIEANVSLAVPKQLKKVTFKEVTFNNHNSAESFIEKVSISPDSGHNIDNSYVELSNVNLSCAPHEPQKIDVVEISSEGYVLDESKQLEDSCMCELSENLSFSEGLEQSETGDSWERLEDVSSIEPIVSESLPVSTEPIVSESFPVSIEPIVSESFPVSVEPIVSESFPVSVEPIVSECLPVSTPIPDAIKEDSDVPKEKMKSHPGRNWKSVCFIIVLLGTIMLSATNFTTMHSLVPKDLNFELYEWSEVGEIVKANFEDFTGKVEEWSADSISYLNKMDFPGKVKQWSANTISYLNKIELPVLEADKMVGPLQFMNLTILEDDYQMSSFFDVTCKGKGFEEGIGLELEEDEGEDEMGLELEEEEAEDEIDEVNDTMEDIEEEIEEVEYEMEEIEDEMKEDEETDIIFDSTVHMVSAPEAPDTMESKKMVDNQENYLDVGSKDGSTEIPKEPESSFGESEIQAQTSMLESKKMVDNQESYLDVGLKDESIEIPKEPESSFGEEDSYSTVEAQTSILGICLVLLGVSTVAVIIYLKQLSKTASTYVHDTSPINKKKIEFLQQKEPSMDYAIGESCASEMSISQMSSSSYQKKKNPKRESLVYSSEYSFGSTSYGSFTTYETIPIKHGDVDEEIATPVRRSSRIRKQITSQ